MPDDNDALRHAAPFVVALSESNISVGGATNVMDALLHANSNTRSQLTQQATRYARYVRNNDGKAQRFKPDINELDEQALGFVSLSHFCRWAIGAVRQINRQRARIQQMVSLRPA